jgi:hypothetical protein
MEFLIGAGNLEFLKVRIAVEKFLVVRNAIVFDPDIGVVEPVGKAAAA